MIAPELSERFERKRVLVTGGLGFIGSTLARELVEAGSSVILVDSLVPENGGSLYNIAGIDEALKINISGDRDEYSLRHLVQGPGLPYKEYAGDRARSPLRAARRHWGRLSRSPDSTI